MLLVLALCLLFGVVKFIFPEGRVALAALVALMIGFGCVVAVAVVIRRNRFTEALIVVALAGITISLFLPAVQFGPRKGRRPPCTNNLRQIAAAMVVYESTYESLPPPYISDAKGKPMHSWRVLLLPFLDEQELYDQYRFDEPWDGPNNKKLHDRIVEVYRCPDDHPARASKLARETSYVVVVGPGTVFSGGRRNKMSIADVANGDGASNTILIVEVHSSGIHWMEPRDLDFATMDFQINGKKGVSISSKHAGGAMVVMVDGSVRYLDDKTPPKDIERLITIRDDAPLPLAGEK